MTVIKLDAATFAKVKSGDAPVFITDETGIPQLQIALSTTLTVGGGERVLTFVPDQPWAKGEYRLVADRRLEDVCGNRVGEAFELEGVRPAAPKSEATTAERKFRVR